MEARRTGILPDTAYGPVLRDLIRDVNALPYARAVGVTHSPVTGNTGTREFFLHVSLSQGEAPDLDAAVDAGTNTTYGIAFSSTQENEAYQKALARAVEDAMQKAQVLANAAGVQLGGLTLINATKNTTGYTDTYGISNVFTFSEKAADRGTTITSGDVTVSAEVVLEYRFE